MSSRSTNDPVDKRDMIPNPLMNCFIPSFFANAFTQIAMRNQKNYLM